MTGAIDAELDGSVVGACDPVLGTRSWSDAAVSLGKAGSDIIFRCGRETLWGAVGV